MFRSLALTAVIALVSSGCRPKDIHVTETPIRITDQKVGYGDPVGKGDTVRVNYRIALPDGRLVLNQSDYRFQVGTDSVIRGVDEAVLGMRTGGTRIFTCPPHKHWGRAGYANGLIPPATDLTIRLELIRVEQRGRHSVRTAVVGSDEE